MANYAWSAKRIDGRSAGRNTIIAEDVRDLETHRKKILDPDEYRAAIGACWACGSKTLHALCFRERVLRGAVSNAPVVATVRLYRCALRTCGAVFTVLPAVIARHLWRLWETVEAATTGKLEVPDGTRRRWFGRLRSCGSQILQAFTTRAASILSVDSIQRLSKSTIRSEILDAFRTLFTAQVFALVSAWIHRLEPGIRLM